MTPLSNRHSRRTPPLRSAAWVAFLFLLGLASSAHAFHLFRGNEASGCSPASNVTQPECCPASGDLTDNSVPTDAIGATVSVLHNSFNDEATLAPVVTVIHAGEAVRWRWASSHCHSVQSDDGTSFNSGFMYPTTPPAGQSVFISGFFDYPVPDPNPSLSWTHTFSTVGVYPYHCVHHLIIGMEGVVIVVP